MQKGYITGKYWIAKKSLSSWNSRNVTLKLVQIRCSDWQNNALIFLQCTNRTRKDYASIHGVQAKVMVIVRVWDRVWDHPAWLNYPLGNVLLIESLIIYEKYTDNLNVNILIGYSIYELNTHSNHSTCSRPPNPPPTITTKHKHCVI